MRIQDKLWKKLPDVISYVVHDERGYSGFCYRPVFNAKANQWESTQRQPFACLDINGISLPKSFHCLRRMSSNLAICQRPSSWDGKLRKGDVVQLEKKSNIYLISGFFNKENVWLENTISQHMTISSWQRIIVVNGMTVKEHMRKYNEREDSAGLPPEIYNQSVVDGEKAMIVTRSMCKSFC